MIVAPTIGRVSGSDLARVRRPRVDDWAITHRLATDVLFALALAAVLGALTLSGAQGVHWSAGWIVVLAVAFAVLHAMVALRRSAPLIAYVLASAAMLAVALAPDGRVVRTQPSGPEHVTALLLPSSAAFLVLLYSAAARLPATLGRGALAVALIGAVLAAVRIAGTLEEVATSWLVPIYVGVGVAVTVLATWGLGRLSAARAAHAAAERDEAARLAVLEERARLAGEMHDIVAHSLAVMVRQAEGGAYVADREPDRAAHALHTIAETGRSALSDMRGLLRVLRDPDAGEQAAPRPTLADLPVLLGRVRDTGLDVELCESGEPFPVGAATELAVYRLAQEGLTNAVKYAGRRAHVAVAVQWGPTELTVEVRDDGGGGDGPPAVPGTGAGLQGLRDRVAAAGGTFAAEPLPRGFQVRARFPRPGRERVR